METKKIQFTKVKKDINGNSRYVCHFLNFITDKDIEQIKEDYAASLEINPFMKTEFMYDLALFKAKKLGGKKFHNKQFGGGIVFQETNPDQLEKEIFNLIKND